MALTLHDEAAMSISRWAIALGVIVLLAFARPAHADGQWQFLAPDLTVQTGARRGADGDDHLLLGYGLRADVLYAPGRRRFAVGGFGDMTLDTGNDFQAGIGGSVMWLLHCDDCDSSPAVELSFGRMIDVHPVFHDSGTMERSSPGWDARLAYHWLMTPWASNFEELGVFVDYHLLDDPVVGQRSEVIVGVEVNPFIWPVLIVDAMANGLGD
jgi:hypothetical protein